MPAEWRAQNGPEERLVERGRSLQRAGVEDEPASRGDDDVGEGDGGVNSEVVVDRVARVVGGPGPDAAFASALVAPST